MATAIDAIHPKVAASTLGGALSTLGFEIALQLGAHPSPGLIAGVTTIAAFAIGWLVPEKYLQTAADDASALETPALQVITGKVDPTEDKAAEATSPMATPQTPVVDPGTTLPAPTAG